MITYSEETKTAIYNDPELGVISDVQLAKKHDVSAACVRKIRNDNDIPPFEKCTRAYAETPKKSVILADPDLGKVPDSVIAERYNVNRELVVVIRTKAGIHAYYGASKTHPMAKYIRADKDLGKVPDLYLAARYGVERAVICSIRRQDNIPLYHKPPPTRLQRLLDYIWPKEKSTKVERAAHWSKAYMDKWGRPKNIDEHLEWLRDNTT